MGHFHYDNSIIVREIVIHTLILTEILWDELLAVVHDEDSAHVQLDVVLLLLVLKEVERSTPRHEEQGTEFKLTLY